MSSELGKVIYMSVDFYKLLYRKMDEYVDLVYEISCDFPSDERFGVISQIRRSSLSVILNFIEGNAHRKNKVCINYLEISYGSLQESKYLLKFSLRHKFVIKDVICFEAISLADEIGAMLWKTINLKKEDLGL